MIPVESLEFTWFLIFVLLLTGYAILDGFDLGVVVQHGRKLKDNVVRLDKKLLNQHIFLSGLTEPDHS